MESHTRARARSPRLAWPGLAWPGLAWPGLAGPGRRARAHDMRVNGPPKSGPSPCGGAATFCRLIFFGFLAVTLILTDRYKISTDCEIFVGG